MNQTKNNEVNEKCTMSMSGSCCHPEIMQVKQEIVCNGTPIEMRCCPIFLRTKRFEEKNIDIEKIFEIGKLMWNDFVESAHHEAETKEKIDKTPTPEQERVEKDRFGMARIVLPLVIGLIKEDPEKTIGGVRGMIWKGYKDNLSDAEFEQILEFGTRIFKDVTESAVKKALQKTDIEKKVDALQEENDNLRKQIAEKTATSSHRS